MAEILTNPVFMKCLIAYNIFCFGIMGYDKRQAITHGWRASERGLMTLALILGGPGILAGMLIFRHKTLHPKFAIGVPVCIALNIAIITFILKDSFLS